MAVARIAVNASDPSVDGALLAWHEAGAHGVLSGGPEPRRVAGTHPAVGGARLAVLQGAQIAVSHTSGPAFARTIPAPGADALAVSAEWVAWRAREGDGDAIYAARLADGATSRLMRASELGRPAIDGDRVVFHVAGQRAGRIVLADLGRGRTRTLRRERRAQLLNPSLHGNRVLYVRAIYKRQELRIGPLKRRRPRRDGRVWTTVPTGRRDAGHERGRRHHRHGHPRKLWRRPRRNLSLTLWTTALGPEHAYVTRLRQTAGSAPVAEILRVSR